MKLMEVAELVRGWVAPENESVEIHGPASLSEAGPGDLAFYGNAKYLSALRSTSATAVLVPHGCAEEIRAVRIWVDDPARAFALVLERFTPPPRVVEPGIHPSAVVSPEATIDPSASIGANVVIGRGAVVGARTRIDANSSIGESAALGADVQVHAGVTVCDRCLVGDRVILHPGVVVGSDGFGYEFKDGRQVKIPQTGIVQIDEDVEIGANTTIDRARFGRTWIQKGVKIDNLVQIAHNVRVGEHSVICAQVGVSGSTRIGSYVTLAGQVGVVGHLEVGDRVIVAAQSGVNRSVPAGEIYGGGPARPIKEYREQCAQINRLGKLYARVKKLESEAANRSDH